MQEGHDIWKWQEPGEAWKGVGLYHVTLTIPSRDPLLGTLVIPDNDPAQARVDILPLGKGVLDCLREVPVRHLEIQILHYCLMPDHLHAVWYVKKQMPKGILTAVRGFWQGAKKAADTLALSSITPNTIRENTQERIFTEMPYVRPMGQRRQLPATIRYIDMNPQRLATKRLMPGYFRVQEDIEIAGRKYSGVGNIALLQAERFAPVHVRRTMVDEAVHGDDKRLRDYMNGCVIAARQGAVMVSPFISEKEKEVMVVLLAEEHPIIILADNGFRDYYKPSDGIFDAVAEGRVLILSPWEYDASKRHISRADCVALNGMAEEICRLSSITPNSIREKKYRRLTN